VAAGGRAVLRVIRTGIEREGFVEITGGLDPGDEVITTRAGIVRDGTRIEVYRR